MRMYSFSEYRTEFSQKIDIPTVSCYDIYKSKTGLNL
jgi:hypothetical protein